MARTPSARPRGSHPWCIADDGASATDIPWSPAGTATTADKGSPLTTARRRPNGADRGDVTRRPVGRSSRSTRGPAASDAGEGSVHLGRETAVCLSSTCTTMRPRGSHPPGETARNRAVRRQNRQWLHTPMAPAAELPAWHGPNTAQRRPAQLNGRPPSRPHPHQTPAGSRTAPRLRNFASAEGPPPGSRGRLAPEPLTPEPWTAAGSPDLQDHSHYWAQTSRGTPPGYRDRLPDCGRRAVPPLGSPCHHPPASATLSPESPEPDQATWVRSRRTRSPSRHSSSSGRAPPDAAGEAAIRLRLERAMRPRPALTSLLSGTRVGTERAGRRPPPPLQPLLPGTQGPRRRLFPARFRVLANSGRHQASGRRTPDAPRLCSRRASDRSPGGQNCISTPSV